MLKAAGLYTINEYIGKRRHMVVKCTTGRPVYAMVLSVKRLTGTPPRLLWTDQNLDLPEIYETPLPSFLRNATAVVVWGRVHSAPPNGNRPNGRLRYMDALEDATL